MDKVKEGTKKNLSHWEVLNSALKRGQKRLQHRDRQDEEVEEQNVLEEHESQERLCNPSNRVKGNSVAVATPGKKESLGKVSTSTKTPIKTFIEIKWRNTPASWPER